MSRWAILLVCKYFNAFRISRMHICAWTSVSEPSSSIMACSSPPVALWIEKNLGKYLLFYCFLFYMNNTYNSRISAVSVFDSWTAFSLTMCSESAHNISTAISWPISRRVHCARRRRRKNLAAYWTPVFLWMARRTAANFPLGIKVKEYR